jgi:hypothetical protein
MGNDPKKITRERLNVKTGREEGYAAFTVRVRVPDTHMPDSSSSSSSLVQHGGMLDTLFATEWLAVREEIFLTS